MPSNLNTDFYFNRDLEALLKGGYGEMPVVYQVFFRQPGMLCGLSDVIVLLKDKPSVKVYSLNDGERFEALETVMLIHGSVQDLFNLETEILSAVSITGAATGMSECVIAAKGKPVYDFSARHFPSPLYPLLGYAAWVGGAKGTSTEAGAKGAKERGAVFFEAGGTVPHATAAITGGTIEAADLYAKYIDADHVIALPDFEGKEKTIISELAKKYGDKLETIRLDTHGGRVHQTGTDHISDVETEGWISEFADRTHIIGPGVTVELTKNARQWLDESGAKRCQIVVSSGFNAEKIRKFEEAKAPVDAYGTGGWVEFWPATMDIVKRKVGRNWQECAKVGRQYKENSRLKAQ